MVLYVSTSTMKLLYIKVANEINEASSPSLVLRPNLDLYSNAFYFILTPLRSWSWDFHINIYWCIIKWTETRHKTVCYSSINRYPQFVASHDITCTIEPSDERVLSGWKGPIRTLSSSQSELDQSCLWASECSHSRCVSGHQRRKRYKVYWVLIRIYT